MRPLALCAGILAAVFVLYLLGHERSGEREHAAPLPLRTVDEPALEELVPSLTATAEAETPVAVERGVDGVQVGHWQLLPLEGTPIALRRGFFVRGQVVDSRTRWGIAGARLELIARLDGAEDSLLSGTTASEGRFEMRVPREGPRHWEREIEEAAEEERLIAEAKRVLLQRSEAAGTESPTGRRPPDRDADLMRMERARRSYPGHSRVSLVLRITTSGFLPREFELAIDPSSDGDHDLGVIALEPGEVFTGRVLGLLESGVPNVAVYLVSADDLRRLKSTRTNALGEYSLPLPLPGMYHVHARAEDQGAAVLSNVELPPIGDPVLADLLLRGDGQLTGVVTYIDGSPAEAVSVLAIPAEFAGLPLASIPPERLVYEEMNGGIFGNSATSDSDGSYEIPYLASAPYLLRFGSDLAYETGPPAVPSTSVRLEYPHNRLRVRVRTPPSEDGEWTAPTVDCAELIALADGTVDRRMLDAPMESPSSGDRFFQVEPGHSYEVRALRGGEVLDPRVLTVAATPCESIIGFRFSATRPSESAVDSELVDHGYAAAERARRDGRSGGKPRHTSLSLVLDWQEGVPAATSLPPIEGALERLVEGRAPIAVEVVWSLEDLPEGSSLPGRMGELESQALPAGRYRLRLRMEDTQFYEGELVHGTSGVPGLPCFFATVPMPQNPGTSAR